LHTVCSEAPGKTENESNSFGVLVRSEEVIKKNMFQEVSLQLWLSEDAYSILFYELQCFLMSPWEE
jgi:hypothetical protein